MGNGQKIFMRLVHTCLRYPPATGGVETYVQGLVEHTRQFPARDVRVLTSKLRTHGPISELEPSLLLQDQPFVQRLHHARTPLLSYPRLQALNYYLKHHQPHLLHSYSFWYQPADITARYAQRHNIPFIFHPIYYENSIRRKLSWQIYKNVIGQQTFAAADIVAVISPYEQSLITQAGFSVKRFELIPPGLDLAAYQTATSNPFQVNAEPVLLTISRLAPGKGLEDMLNALPILLKNHPQLLWYVIGEDFGLQSKLLKKAHELGVEKHITLAGKLSEKEKISALKHATLLVHPSPYEAFGIVLAEALACELPIVARKVAAIPFVAPPNQASLLFTTQDELIQHLTTLLNQPSLRQQLGQFGQKYIAQNFTWDKSTNKLLRLYDELLPV
jgi:glycosyltransferase involved in cell wall biosynthesis